MQTKFHIKRLGYNSANIDINPFLSWGSERGDRSYSKFEKTDALQTLLFRPVERLDVNQTRLRAPQKFMFNINYSMK